MGVNLEYKNYWLKNIIKKILGAPGPPTGEIWGTNFQLPPFPLQIPSSKVGVLPAMGSTRARLQLEHEIRSVELGVCPMQLFNF